MSANICCDTAGHLELDVAAVADDPGADLDQLLAQAGQATMATPSSASPASP
jgi:hypothetical protein